jgi:glutathione synthase
VVERFLPPDAAALVRTCFAGLWALDGADADAVVAMALAEPAAFVLKPQREGGGNNLYGEEMVARLAQREGLGAFILMQRIRPALNRALFMRAGVAAPADALCELGVYSVFLSVRGQAVRNEAVGHLLRTKTADSNEGGVAAGFAVLDSPMLV